MNEKQKLPEAPLNYYLNDVIFDVLEERTNSPNYNTVSPDITKRKFIRLWKMIGDDFLKLSESERMFMIKTAGVIKLPWIGRFYKDNDFDKS